ncbi:MAG: hypothetical protein KA175_03815 [Flavobacteriales bacterium]|nr:hypothetical protein [Flavobacteriales bacterium]
MQVVIEWWEKIFLAHPQARQDHHCPPQDGVDPCRICALFIRYYNHRRKRSRIGNVMPAG